MERSGEPGSQTIEHAFRGDGSAVRVMAVQAMRLADEGQFQIAETLLDGLVAALTTMGGKEESLAHTYFALGYVLEKCDRHMDAAAAFKQAYDLHDRSDPKERWGRWSCAANRALALWRGEVDQRDIECEFKEELGVGLDEAKKELEGGPEQVKDRPASALLALGVLNFAADCGAKAKEFWEEVEEVEEVKGTDEEKAYAAINLANLYVAEGEFDDAEKYIKKAKSHCSGVTLTNALATTLAITEADWATKEKKWDVAESQLKLAHKTEPYRSRTLYRMGVVAALREKYDEAETWLKRTISVAPWNAKAQADLVRVQLARDGGGARGGLLGLNWRRRLLIAAPFFVVGLGIMLCAAWCQPDQVQTTTTWGTAATATSNPAGAGAAATPEGQEALALTAATAPAGGTESVQSAEANAEPTPTPSQVTETRKEPGFQDIPTGFVTIGTLIIAIGLILLLLPEVTTIKAAGIEVTPIQAPRARPSFIQSLGSLNVETADRKRQRPED